MILGRRSPPNVAKNGSAVTGEASRSAADWSSLNSISEEARLPACQASNLYILLRLTWGRRFQSNSSTIMESVELGNRKLAYAMLYANSRKFSNFSIATKLISACTCLRAIPTFR
jgi:hypothetical protein